MINNNHGQIMFIPLVCSVLWLTPNPGAAKDAEQTGKSAEESGTRAVGNSAVRPRKFTWPPTGRVPGTAIAMEGENPAPDDGQLWSAEVLACKSKLYDHVKHVAINLENPSQPIGNFYTYEKMHAYTHTDTTKKYVLQISESDCSPNGPAYTARMLMLDVVKPERMLVFLTSRYGELVRAALQTNDAAGPHAKEVDTSIGSEAEQRFKALVKIVLSDKNVLAYARQKRTTTKDGTGKPR